MRPNYDNDFYGWAMAEATLLRQGKWDELDVEHLAMELEFMGASEKREFVSRMAQLIFHLIKWQYQPDFRTRSWNGTIKEQRLRLSNILEDNPSLRSFSNESMKKAYKIALTLIEKETPLEIKSLPDLCPYTFIQMIDDHFYP